MGKNLNKLIKRVDTRNNLVYNIGARDKGGRKMAERTEKTVAELRAELKAVCEKHDTRYSGMEYLVNYYIKTFRWTEKEALEHALKLFHDGTNTQIKIIDKDGNEL